MICKEKARGGVVRIKYSGKFLDSVLDRVNSLMIPWINK